MEFGFRKINSSDCLSAQGNGSQKVVYIVYIDDLIILSPRKEPVEKTKYLLRNKFELEDLGEVQYYLGNNFKRRSKQIVFSEGVYRRPILKRFEMEHAAYSPTPMVKNFDNLLKTTHVDEAEIEVIEHVHYPTLVASLLYLSFHRSPGIALALGVLERFVEIPSRLYWKAGKRILQHLARTSDHGIVVGSVEPVVLK